MNPSEKHKHKATGGDFPAGSGFYSRALVTLACRVNICIMRLPGDNHLFEDHELIQEVDALAGEELPDGLLSPEGARVSGGAELDRLVLQEV